jgi:hypothetical protein
MKSSQENPTDATWRNSDAICALADGERHLGHILKIGDHWHAFDGTRMNAEMNGFRPAGCFVSIAAAKAAVEQCTTTAKVAHLGAA